MDLREWWKQRFNEGKEFRKAKIIKCSDPTYIEKIGDIIEEQKKGIWATRIAFPEFWTNTDEQHDQYPWDAIWCFLGEYKEVK